MKLSVIVPVFNEAATLKKVVERLVAVREVKEIIVVNDGSTDGTKKILDRLSHRKLKVFHKTNGGKGSAIRFGLRKVTGDFVLIQDADLEYDPRDIPILTKAVERHDLQVVYGSRFLGPHSNLLFWHRVGNGFLNLVVNILFDTTLSDMETCYKLIPTKLLKELELTAHKFDIEPEITCKILLKNIKIFEVPITYIGRDFSEGKKITWWDGIDALYTIIKIRLIGR